MVLLAEIGVGLAGFGIAFLFLGVMMFFDRGLLAIGNVRKRVSFTINCLLPFCWDMMIVSTS